MLPNGKLARQGLGWVGTAGITGHAYSTGFSGKRWVGSVTAVSRLTVTVVKLRLGGPGIGARVVSRFRVI